MFKSIINGLVMEDFVYVTYKRNFRTFAFITKLFYFIMLLFITSRKFCILRLCSIEYFPCIITIKSTIQY